MLLDTECILPRVHQPASQRSAPLHTWPGLGWAGLAGLGWAGLVATICCTLSPSIIRHHLLVATWTRQQIGHSQSVKCTACCMLCMLVVVILIPTSKQNSSVWHHTNMLDTWPQRGIINMNEVGIKNVQSWCFCGLPILSSHDP